MQFAFARIRVLLLMSFFFFWKLVDFGNAFLSVGTEKTKKQLHENNSKSKQKICEAIQKLSNAKLILKRFRFLGNTRSARKCLNRKRNGKRRKREKLMHSIGFFLFLFRFRLSHLEHWLLVNIFEIIKRNQKKKNSHQNFSVLFACSYLFSSKQRNKERKNATTASTRTVNNIQCYRCCCCCYCNTFEAKSNFPK